MDQTNDLDSGNSNGTAGTPTPVSSEGKSDSSSSFDASKLQSAFDALTRKLDEVDARTKSLQGDKDRAVNKTKSEVDDLKRKIAEIEKLEKSGLDRDTALDEFSFREVVRDLKDQLGKLNPALPQPAGNSAGTAADAAKVLSEFQLDGNDPEVVAQVLSKVTEVEQVRAAAQLALKRANPNQPSPAAAGTLVGKPAPPPNVEELTKDYKKDMIAARGKPSELRAIKDKYIKLGVNIHEVDFS